MSWEHREKIWAGDTVDVYSTKGTDDPDVTIDCFWPFEVEYDGNKRIKVFHNDVNNDERKHIGTLESKIGESLTVKIIGFRNIRIDGDIGWLELEEAEVDSSLCSMDITNERFGVKLRMPASMCFRGSR